MDKKDRTLTVYGKMSKSDKTIPQIRFEGQWLQALGFCVGDKIKLNSHYKSIGKERMIAGRDTIGEWLSLFCFGHEKDIYA